LEPDKEYALDIQLVDKGLTSAKTFYVKWSGDESVTNDEEAIKKMQENIESFKQLEADDGTGIEIEGQLPPAGEGNQTIDNGTRPAQNDNQRADSGEFGT
jgi:hypothetical protein